ncbi:phosphonate ABC transporter, permease protein PhnE [Microbulbifer bruguierae]|uniref:Phosphonate ABC transporter, permease protein PhnE n=1 Tax=Microbulbifer bruguierae TaxID=3029061 RepID=A0ABY8NGR2_9GAMM|nr:phosphonate ABC transporter, permease protein PhnE [Microbulbifer bruguierae]WGL17599.1 phosphonate ABC transporter, permease protein PhnE [Microbulbifer bruguierae]
MTQPNSKKSTRQHSGYPSPIGNLLLLVILLLIVVAAFRYLQLDFSALTASENLRQMGGYLAEFLHPDISTPHLLALSRGAAETLAMSVAGTLLAAMSGIVMALPAAGYFGWLAKQLSRGLLNVLRSIPELVWAALMVLAAGLGPNAGTLALALHTAGVLGRLFAEALENTPPTATEAVRLSGGSHSEAFCYGTLPALWPQLAAYTLYRWENNIRMSSVLGFVGAGGLGQMLYIHLSLFQQAQAATVILAILMLVLAVDSFSQWLRRRGNPGY